MNPCGGASNFSAYAQQESDLMPREKGHNDITAKEKKKLLFSVPVFHVQEDVFAHVAEEP